MVAFGNVTALNIEGRGLPGCITPPGWRPCILEYRRRNRVEPAHPGVYSTSELHGVLYFLHTALTTAIMEWDSNLERIFAGDHVPALHGLYLQHISTSLLGLTLWAFYDELSSFCLNFTSCAHARLKYATDSSQKCV